MSPFIVVTLSPLQARELLGTLAWRGERVTSDNCRNGQIGGAGPH